MRTRRLAVLLALLLVAAGMTSAVQAATSPTAYPGGTWSPPKASYGFSEDYGLHVKVSDGAELVVDVSYPTNPGTGKRAPGPFPVILNQDLYSGSYPNQIQNALGQPAKHGEYFVNRGFIFVHLHDRGTGGSQGNQDAEMGPRIGLDGTELAYWAANPNNVPGSNGVVGLEGCSALGFIQLPTLAALGKVMAAGGDIYVPGRTPDDAGTSVPATTQTNPIKAAIPACLAADLYREQFTDNGIPSAFTWTLSAAQPVTQAGLIGLSTTNPSDNVANMAQFADMMAGGDSGFYRQYWRDRDSVRNALDVERTGAAVLMWPGWGESGFLAAQSMYSVLQSAAAGRASYTPMPLNQKPDPKYQFIIGNWGHGGGLDSGIELEWFQTWLQGVSTGLEKVTTPMHMWEMAPSGTTGRWINASTEPATSTYTALYLDGGGKLSTTTPKTTASDPYVWGAGPPVTYSLGQPYGQDMTLIGPRALRLFVRSSNTNVQLYAELDDVAPDGTASPITHGSILGSRKQTDLARSWTAPNGLPSQPYLTLDQDRYLTPNQPVKLDVPLQPVTWRLPKGHTLQLKLAPNAGVACVYDSTSRQGGAPVFNAPTGCILSKPMLQSLAGGVYQILHDPTHQSALNLPLVPSTSFPTAKSGATPTSSGTALPQNWNS